MTERANDIPAVDDIKSEGTQLFNVPNNAEGLQFLELAKKHLNKHRFSGFRKKGRGKNRPKNRGNGDLRISESEWLAVYPDESDSFRKRSLKSRIEEYKNREQYRSEQEAKLRSKIRMEIAKEQLESGIVLPEVLVLVREQVRKEVMEEISKNISISQVCLKVGKDAVQIELNPTSALITSC